MKKLIYISVFLATLLLSSVVLLTISSIKNYIETIELAEDMSTKNANPTGVEEEEEHHAIFSLIQENSIEHQTLEYFYSHQKLYVVFLDILTRPPIR